MNPPGAELNMLCAASANNASVFTLALNFAGGFYNEPPAPANDTVAFIRQLVDQGGNRALALAHLKGFADTISTIVSVYRYMQHRC